MSNWLERNAPYSSRTLIRRSRATFSTREKEKIRQVAGTTEYVAPESLRSSKQRTLPR
jgi:hypothetical protein